MNSIEVFSIQRKLFRYLKEVMPIFSLQLLIFKEVLLKIAEFLFPRNNPYEPNCVPSYYSGKIREVPDDEFVNLLGRSLPPSKWVGELGLNDAVCQMFYAKSGLARFVCKILTRKKEKAEAQGKPDLNLLFIYNIPFRGIAKMTGGAVSMEMAEGIVSAVNGHFFRGMGKAIKGYFSNAKANKEYTKKLTGGSYEKQD